VTDEKFRRLIEQGDVDGLRSALASDAGLANRPIPWHLNQDNESEPLHYVSDCVRQRMADERQGGGNRSTAPRVRRRDKRRRRQRVPVDCVSFPWGGECLQGSY
jgi:hypothetical protein